MFDSGNLGNIYIADTYNHRIRKVTVSTGIITTIAGGIGFGDFAGDGGAATSATLNNPVDVEVDSSGTYCYITPSLPSTLPVMHAMHPS